MSAASESHRGGKAARLNFRDILDGRDHRLFHRQSAISIHDLEAAQDSCRALSSVFGSNVSAPCNWWKPCLISKKPRTTVGWKGLINDPLSG